MSRSYPYDTLGTTLVQEYNGDERRRVYLKKRLGYVEVGEFTVGILTQAVYNTPAHLHSVHLRGSAGVQIAIEYFSKGNGLLSEFMDELDRKGVAYGYLNSVAGEYVSYRPARVIHGGQATT